MIKAIIFDIDGVLLDSFESNLKFFQELLTATGHRAPTREEYKKMYHYNLRQVLDVYCEGASEEEKTKIWEMRRTGVFKKDLELVKTPDQLEDVIEKLSKKYLLGIATSRVKEGVYEYPRLAKLEKHFEIAVSYQDTENHKPHPEPLLFAAQGLKVKPEECIYIGDAESDVIAAHAAGMKCIIYSRNKIKDADAQTVDFNEIPKLISSFTQVR